jgi:hypothetical protein
MHTTVPLLHGPKPFEVEIDIEKPEQYKSPGIH